MMSGNVAEGIRWWGLKMLCVVFALAFVLSRAEAVSYSTTTWPVRGVEITIFNGPYDIVVDTNVASGVAASTITCSSVALSSCPIALSGGNCYFNCTNPNGTPTQATGTWVQCPQ